MILSEPYYSIYQEMRERNQQIIKSSGLKYDSNLNTHEIDDRKGLAIFAFFNQQQLNTYWQRIYRDAKVTFINQSIYSPKLNGSFNCGLLHFTFMQILKTGDAEANLLATVNEEYLKILETVLFKMEPFTIAYRGLMAVPTGLLMYAYPSIELNHFREQIREYISQRQLPFSEPYKNDIVHSTFIRLTAKEDGEKLIEFANKYNEPKIGMLKINKLYLGYGTWKMLPTETKMLYEFDLRQKVSRKL